MEHFFVQRQAIFDADDGVALAAADAAGGQCNVAVGAADAVADEASAAAAADRVDANAASGS